MGIIKRYRNGLFTVYLLSTGQRAVMPAAGKVTVGLAESSGRLLPGL